LGVARSHIRTVRRMGCFVASEKTGGTFSGKCDWRANIRVVMHLRKRRFNTKKPKKDEKIHGKFENSGDLISLGGLGIIFS